MAGGIEKVVARAQALTTTDIRLACQLIDQAWLAQPQNNNVLTAAYAIYLERLKDDEPLQEALVYLDHLTRLRIAINSD